ncbi:MAG: ankyrin repeat domain-containing protein [Gulosibacter sp.]|uniref:ankyrin repeat domain-containing protein n=1 Tax=Gulosibacter sp. TaxID=2817531 RepID=UPI003F931A17
MTQPSEETIELANRLFDYAREGRTEELAAYLEAGAPVNMRNSGGDSFLTLAAYHDATDTVQMLLERGADLEAANDRGQRALTCAVFKQDESTVRVLLAAGADPDAGQPSARGTAQVFGWPEFEKILSSVLGNESEKVTRE